MTEVFITGLYRHLLKLKNKLKNIFFVIVIVINHRINTLYMGARKYHIYFEC